MSSVICENEIVAELRLQSATGATRTIKVRNGERLCVGSDESAEVCLNDAGVASTHCLISANAGSVSVQDYYSDAGTIVNGNRVRQCQLPDNAEIRIGAAVILVTLQNGSAPPVRASIPDVVAVPADAPKAENEADPERSAGERSPLQVIEEMQSQLQQANAEVEVLERRLTAAAPAPSASAGDPFHEEMTELLRAEIVDLQTALAERDQQLTDSSTGGFATSEVEDVLPQADAERLVERLEQLLAELQQRDEQVATLTQLLDAAEETSQAERDERDQLNAWLGDIEERFGSREMDWQAERGKLQKNVERIAAERDRLELAMNADTSNAKLEATQQLIAGLRQAAESQRQELLDSEATVKQLRIELEQSEHAQSREELVKLAEERAEIARERQQLETARQHEQRAAPNDAALKLRVLRQHLNEIHEQEQKDKDERKLSRRVARLWSRLDGRS